MKTYKLLRDMPTVKAGTTFREITREVDGSKILKEYKSSNKVSILISEINDFDEWFERREKKKGISMKKFSKTFGEILAMVICVFLTAIFMALVVRFVMWIFGV